MEEFIIIVDTFQGAGRHHLFELRPNTGNVGFARLCGCNNTRLDGDVLADVVKACIVAHCSEVSMNAALCNVLVIQIL